MALSKGDTIRLITVDLTMIRFTDWLSSRDAAPGDIARVLEVWDRPESYAIQLVCESRPGFIEWGAVFDEQGLTYEVVHKEVDGTT